MYTPSFAELLRQHRQELGMTQEELAERAGLSARGVQDLERGLNLAPRASTLRLLVSALGLTGSEAAALLRAATHRDAPPAAEGRDRHNLPLPMTSFVPRAGEVGHALVDLFAGGVWLVELESLADASLVARSIAATLGITGGDRPPAEALI